MAELWLTGSSPGDEAKQLKEAAGSMPAITLTFKQACDLEMIAIGAFSPLTGFVGSEDFTSICTSMRTADGTPWPIPITLAIDDGDEGNACRGWTGSTRSRDGTIMAVIDIESIYEHDKALELPNVFRTDDPAHPGVQAVLEEGDWLRRWTDSRVDRDTRA